MIRRPPRSPLFPYTTLFRSVPATTGPYRFLRNPMYTVGYLQTYGLALLVGSRFGLIMALFDQDRKSTRLNSSHLVISYAVFCLKKKNSASEPPALPPIDTPVPICVVYSLLCTFCLSFFFFNDTAPTEISTLPLHDALPICSRHHGPVPIPQESDVHGGVPPDLRSRAAGGIAFRIDHGAVRPRSEEHTSELQSPCNLVCRLLLEKKKLRVRTARTPTHRHSRPYMCCIFTIMHILSFFFFF